MRIEMDIHKWLSAYFILGNIVALICYYSVPRHPKWSFKTYCSVVVFYPYGILAILWDVIRGKEIK